MDGVWENKKQKVADTREGGAMMQYERETTMRRDYLTIVLGMAFMGGAVTGIVIYVGNLFMPHPVIAAAAPTDTLPAPKAVTVIAPTATIVPTAAPTPTAEPVLRARLSHYFPAWGGTNCFPANWDGVNCNTMLTDGRTWEHWSYWENIGVACPARYALGTKFKIDGFGSGIWSCVDRGGAINTLPDGTFFLDLLTREQPYIPPSEADVIYDEFSPQGSLVVTVTIMD